MAKTASKVRVYGDVLSAVWVGAIGATAPTTPTAAPGAGYTELGWLSDAGMLEQRVQASAQKRAWQGAALIRTVRTTDARQFKFVCLETSTIVMGLLRPGSTPVTAISVTTTPVKAFTGSDPRAWVIDQIDGAIHVRKLIANGEVIAMGDIKGTSGDLVSYEVTVECYPDSTGILYTEISDDPNITVP